MQWNQGVYRDAFLDYVRDAYHGRIKRANGRSLEDRLGQPYAVVEKQFLKFLKESKASRGNSLPVEAKPGQRDSIRTVPSG